jgi:hypothetical protein
MSSPQDVYTTLQQIDRLLSDIELKITKLSSEGGSKGASASVMSIRKELHSINMYLVAIERWSGSDTLSGIMNRIQSASQFAIRLQMLLSTVFALEAAVNAGMGPLGWLNLGAQGLGFAISAQNMYTTWGQ